MPFGQVVIGPPGSGKTTYCHGLAQLLTARGRRVALVNLDPANDVLPYEPAVDVADLVCLDTVMDELRLGPNGGLLYCMDYLAANLDWLRERLAPLEAAGAYVILDCPGQVELFTMQPAFKAVLDTFTGPWAYRLAAVQLVDAHLATDAPKYISALLLSLSTMLHLELPQVNVLSKVDLIKQYGRLAFNLDFYTQVQDLTYLLHTMGPGPFSSRYKKLSKGLCEVVEDFGLVGFTPLAIQDQRSLEAVLAQADKANGAVYAALDAPPVPVPVELLVGAGHRAADDDILTSLQETYLDDDDGGGGGGGGGAPSPSGQQQQQQQQGEQQGEQQGDQQVEQQQQQQQQGREQPGDRQRRSLVAARVLERQLSAAMDTSPD